MIQKVFISYRQESDEHSRAVRRLGDLLRGAGLSVMLDQFYLDDHPGGPDERWPKWCEDCMNNSACVLVIGSKGWFEAYDGTAPERKGLGAAVEAALVRQHLYEEKGNNSRFRLAFLHDIKHDDVPVRLRGWEQFLPFENDSHLDRLIAWAAERLGLAEVQAPAIQWPEPLAFTPDLADRLEEWPAIESLLAGRSHARILLYEGESGFGKSKLLRQAAAYARQLSIPTVWVDFKGGNRTVDQVLGQFDLEMSDHLPNFSRQGARATHLLRKDLRGLRRPVLVIFDTYEAVAGSQEVDDWLCRQFLPEIETSLGLMVIIGGQKIPIHSGTGWSKLSTHFPLQPITDPAHWESWVHRRYPNFGCNCAHLLTVLMSAEGNPARVINACDAIERWRS